MSPIDDELRTALSSRTDQVGVTPDLFAGVERRARGMRRQKVAATVAGSALAVSALGLGGPVVASLLTGPTTSGRVADPAPTPSAAPAPAGYALDPDAPWAYRGEPALAAQGDVDAYEVEWAAAHRLLVDQFELVPLFGATHEPSATPEVVYLVRTDAGEHWWGVARATESGPELAVDQPLVEGSTALVAALPGDEVARTLVVAAPAVASVEYAPDDASEWTDLALVVDGVATGPLDGDPSTDRVRVRAPGGLVVHDQPAPDPAPGEPTAPAEDGEGPGTETPADVDVAPYALDLDAPWAYRGPMEAAQHPDLAVQDERLFTAGGSGRDDGSWSQRPLLLVERPDGLSALMVLHRSGDEAYVTTTWQRQDEEPRQSEQAVADGTLVVQTFLPQSDGTGVLIALAAPRTGAIETPALREQAHNADGWALWETPAAVPAGDLLLYSEGDGLLFHSEPLRRS